jgi:seryl-tRNA synthetase
MGEAKVKSGEAWEELKAQALVLKERIPAQEESLRVLEAALREHMLSLPNVPCEDVPFGVDETGNCEIHRVGEVPSFGWEALDHVALGVGLGLMDFERTAAMSGSRFVTLAGPLARLERVLADWMLSMHVRAGYTEMSPPYLVRDQAMEWVGQLPKFAEDSFQTTTGYRLIPTSEVSLTGLVAGQTVPEDRLPLRWTAYSPCFRSEAGSAGRDTRGMIRQHQFSKVELVSITTAEQGLEELERMTRAAEMILEALGLPYRRMLLCTGDMGFSSVKTYDLEVWLPGQGAYREISSCSYCGDFIGRRMQSRYRMGGGSGPLTFVHTLNGSGLAVGRTLVAIMENYQQADGSVRVPDILRDAMGIDRITKEAGCVFW